MLNVIYADKDAALAQDVMARLAKDVKYQDARKTGVSTAPGAILLFAYSDGAMDDPPVREAVYKAFDNKLNILIVTRDQVKLPRILNHLPLIDLNLDPQMAKLKEQIHYLTGPNAPAPMRVLTPQTRKSNMVLGSILFILVMSMFVIGLVAIGSGAVRPPADEYNAVETAISGTIAIEIQTELDQYIGFLPRSTEDAANYAATLQQVPTRYRPFMAETATGAALQTQSPAATATLEAPAAEATPAS